MKSLIRQDKYFRSTGRKAVMALAFASVISGLSISPAFADNDDGHGRGDQHRDRKSYDYREGYRYPYVYAQPVYAPPPVYYEPRPSPGISIFFPIDLR